MTDPRSPHMARAHRHDLDGLRGVGIALVALHHVFAGRVSGGVDVFLTLSGFFLVISLTSRAERLEDGHIATTLRAIGSAWWRIVRRLLPSAVVVLAGTLVAGRLFLPRSQWEETARQGLASLTYRENWHLIANGIDYEKADLAVSPMQHFWSLSVQGQIFLVIPAAVLLVAWLVRRAGPAADLRLPLLVVLGTLAAASFGHALYAVAADQGAAYYNTFARGWEILVGGLLALALPWLRRSAAAVGEAPRMVVGLVALAAIGSCGFLLDGRFLFPGWATWWPVGATLLLIWAGAAPSTYGADRVLASRPILLLGEHAYALYLWHWPVLIIYLTYRGQQEVGWRGGAIVLATSMVLAVVTKRVVEDPMRAPFHRGTDSPFSRIARARTAIAAAGCVGALVLTVGGASAYIADVEDKRQQLEHDALFGSPDHIGAVALTDPRARELIDEVEVKPPVHMARHDQLGQLRDDCTVEPREDPPKRCVVHQSDSGPVVALVGGSHSRQLVPSLHYIARAREFTLVVYLAAGCPWGGKRPPERDRGCRAHSDRLTDVLIAEQPDLVITTATRPINSKSGNTRDHVPESYARVWRKARAAGLDLVAVRDNPWRHENLLPCVGNNLDGGVDQVNAKCGIERDRVLSDPPPQIPVAGVEMIDLSDLYCRSDFCNVIEGNVLIYRDRHHLTSTYVRTLTPDFDRRLGKATGWWRGPLPEVGQGSE